MNHWCIIPCCFFGGTKKAHTNFPQTTGPPSTMAIPESLRSKIGSNSGSRKRRRPKSRRTRTAPRGATWRRSMVVHGGFFSSRWFWCHLCVCFFFSGRWWRFQRKKEAKAESWMAVFTEFFWSKWISLLFGNPLVKGVFQFMKYCNIKAQRGPVLWSWKETSWIILRIAAGKMLVADMSPGPTKTYKNATDFFMNLALLCLGSKLYILQYSILSILYNVYISTVYILQ